MVVSHGFGQLFAITAVVRQIPQDYSGAGGDGATNDETAYARRKFLTRAVIAIHAAIAAVVAAVLGGAILSPAFGQKREEWIAASSLDELIDDEPVAVTIRVARQDGYARTVDRQVVFLVRTGETTVRALSSVCTHLGCRVRWHAGDRELRCPCHGGVFDAAGHVKAGPPPAPLAALPTRIEDGRVLVQA